MYGYVYITTNNANGKKYIGQKKSCVFLHEKYLGSGKYLRNAIKHYGKENFTVELLDECDSKEQLDDRERYWIKSFNAVCSDTFYNIASGGEGANFAISATTRLKMSKSHTGIKLSDETKQKISNSKKGRAFSTEHLQNLKNANAKKGYKHSFETRMKMREAHKSQIPWNKGKKMTDEYKAKISAGRQQQIYNSRNNGLKPLFNINVLPQDT